MEVDNCPLEDYFSLRPGGFPLPCESECTFIGFASKCHSACVAFRAEPQDMLRENPEVIGEYGALLESWCRDIERYLEEGLDQQAVEKEPGPRGELETLLQEDPDVGQNLYPKDPVVPLRRWDWGGFLRRYGWIPRDSIYWSKPLFWLVGSDPSAHPSQPQHAAEPGTRAPSYETPDPSI